MKDPFSLIAISLVFLLAKVSLADPIQPKQDNAEGVFITPSGKPAIVRMAKLNCVLLPKGKFKITTTIDALALDAVKELVDKHYGGKEKLEVDFVRFVKLPYAISGFSEKDELLLSYTASGFHSDKSPEGNSKCLIWYNPTSGQSFLYDAPIMFASEDDWTRLYPMKHK